MGLEEAIARAFAREGARVVCVDVQVTPCGVLGEPVDVAHAAVYLASDESRWITGVLLPVDGGYTAR